MSTFGELDALTRRFYAAIDQVDLETAKHLIIDRWVDGRIIEHFGQFDALGRMQQLGATPG